MNTELFELMRDTVKEKGVAKKIDSYMIDLYRKQYDMTDVFEEIRNRELTHYRFIDLSNDRYDYEYVKNNIQYYLKFEQSTKRNLPYIYIKKMTDTITSEVFFTNEEEKKKKICEPFCEPIQYGERITKQEAVIKKKMMEIQKTKKEIEEEYYRRVNIKNHDHGSGLCLKKAFEYIEAKYNEIIEEIEVPEERAFYQEPMGIQGPGPIADEGPFLEALIDVQDPLPIGMDMPDPFPIRPAVPYMY